MSALDEARRSIDRIDRQIAELQAEIEALKNGEQA